MLSGFRKEDPATMKKMPVEADVPELLVKMGNECTATELTKAVGDLALMAFYYLLRVGEYTVKRTRNCTKQTKQFKLEDVQFFEKKRGRIRRLARNATDEQATMKKMPVEADVPELLVKMGNECTATELTKAVGDLALMAFYYLLRVGEYTVKRTRNCTKQTKQFKLEDVQFFEKKRGRIRRLARNASDEQIMAATSATLKLDNSKNGWKGVCVHQEANGEERNCGVRAIGRRYCYIRHMTASLGTKKQYKTFLSAYWIDGKRCDVNDEDIRANIKWAAGILDYEGTRNIPVDRVDTHSLRSGGANALSLSGYSDRQIMKMGRWKSATFMEYIREELACFSEGMSKNMKRSFGFVNVAGGAYHDITSTVLLTEYDTPASAA